MENIDFRITEITRVIERSSSIGWHVENLCYDEYYAVAYVLDGETEYIIDEKKYSVKKDDIIVFPPKTMRSGKTNPEHPWSFINILFRMETNESAANYFNKSIIIMKNINDSIRKRFMDVSNAWTGKNPLHQVKCNYLTTEIIYKMILSEMPYHKVPHIKKLEKARKMIQYNFRSDISVEDLAASIDLSVSYFRRLFHNLYGVSPKQYILSARLRWAKTMLKTTEDSITEIAKNCGFDNVYYFSRAFRIHEGVSPSEYRNHHREVGE